MGRELKNGGTGLRWDELNEDLSLRGFITNNRVCS
jgi:hypothetical protein